MNTFKTLACSASAAVLFGIGGLAHAQTPVTVELSLLLDVSGSVDGGEFNLQRGGYVAAFNNPALHALFTPTQTLAVNLIQWSSGNQQVQSIGYTLVNDAASSMAFANLVNGITRAFNGNTGPGSAIAFATPLFASNAFDGLRQVIDVSGDGSQNSGIDTSDARDAALAAGVDTINGLPILGSEAGLLAFYQNNIQGGANSFTLAADGFNDFERAVFDKLRFEITGTTPVIPVPAALPLMISGLLALGFIGRRRKS